MEHDVSLQKAYSLMASAMGTLAEATEHERLADLQRAAATAKADEAKMLFLEAGMEPPTFDRNAKVKKAPGTR